MVKKTKGGIPKGVLDELDIHVRHKVKPVDATIIVEKHQAKISIPKILRLRLNLKENTKCKMIYDKDKKEIICRLK